MYFVGYTYTFIHTYAHTHVYIYICTYTLYIDININKQIQSNPICPIFLTRSTTCLVRVATGLCPILCQPHPRWNGFIKVRVPKSDGEPWAGCWASWANKTLDELDWNSWNQAETRVGSPIGIWARKKPMCSWHDNSWFKYLSGKLVYLNTQACLEHTRTHHSFRVERLEFRKLLSLYILNTKMPTARKTVSGKIGTKQNRGYAESLSDVFLVGYNAKNM
jgi:hypothetical protein